VIGSGESAGADDQTAPLRRLAEELGLMPAVRFLGRLADADLLDWYAAADVFALPSTSEAQGIAALEAMASGLPVVASAVGGLLQTIEDDLTGCLVPPGDVDGLAARLLELLARPARRAAIGAAARAAVLRDFAWQRCVDATLEVYREVLAE
jgi:glycosyltransferase involved in cell wall biosynthesis